MSHSHDSLTRLSKYLSLVLRHHPEKIHLSIDEHGWADAQELIDNTLAAGRFDLSRDVLEEIVRTDSKQRYSWSEDGRRIRANQGHSIPVDLELAPQTPPDVLYHGTGQKSVPSIQRQGLLHMQRLYVHLSRDIDTAVTVGRRHGACAVFRVDAAQMARDGFPFYQSVNRVWLTGHVPARYLHLLDG